MNDLIVGYDKDGMKNVYTSGIKTIVRPIFPPCFAFFNIFVTSIDFQKTLDKRDRPADAIYASRPSGDFCASLAGQIGTRGR
jgi:hypothetical protein